MTDVLHIWVNQHLEDIHSEIINLNAEGVKKWEEEHKLDEGTIIPLLSTIISNKGNIVIDKQIVSPCPVFDKDKDKLNAVMESKEAKKSLYDLLLAEEQKPLAALSEFDDSITNKPNLTVHTMDAFADHDFQSTLTIFAPHSTKPLAMDCPNVFDIACPKLTTQLEEVYLKIEVNHHKINMMYAQATMLNTYMENCINGLKDVESRKAFISSIKYTSHGTITAPGPIETLARDIDVFASESKFYLDVLKQNGRSL
jgi:hypothetical protein